MFPTYPCHKSSLLARKGATDRLAESGALVLGPGVERSISGKTGLAGSACEWS